MTLEQEILEFTTKLKFRQVEGSLPCARRTAEILRLLITTRRPIDGASLLEDVRQVGVRIQRVKPMEVSIGNMVRRIMRLIREEMAVLGEQSPQQKQGDNRNFDQQSSNIDIEGIPRPNLELRNLLDCQIVQENEENKVEKKLQESSLELSLGEMKKIKKPQWKGKQNVIDGVNELFFELDNVDSCICQQAVDHIHANEVVLTLGNSNTTYEFLVEAHKKRQFAVVVAEAAPVCSGHAQAKRLASAGIQTTVITDAAVYGIMARVNKVLVGAHAVLANGGIIGAIGTHLLALSAKQHAVPFVVLVGLQKLSPLFPHDPYLMFNDFRHTANVVDYDVQAELFDHACNTDANDNEAENDQMYMNIPNPGHDYVPPELISLMVTDGGGFTPQYVYRLLSEYYSREDYILSQQLLNQI